MKHLPLIETAQLIHKENHFSLHQIIDPSAKYPYLHDHQFGGKLFMPATGIMEYFAEAASFWCEKKLHGSYHVRELRNLNIERAIAIMPGSTLTIDLTYTSSSIEGPQAIISMEIHSSRINAAGNIIGRRMNASCTVEMTLIPYHEQPLAPSFQEPASHYDCYAFLQNNYYNFYYPSHGPLFQSLTGRFKVSRDLRYLIGEYDCSDKQSRYVTDNTQEFLLSPLGYDSCLQYAVYLSRIRDLSGRLPVSCPRVIIHRRHPVKGYCYALIECVHINEEIMDCHIRCYDHEGLMIMEAESFRVQKAFFHRYTRNDFDQPLRENQVQQLSFNP